MPEPTPDATTNPPLPEQPPAYLGGHTLPQSGGWAAGSGTRPIPLASADPPPPGAVATQTRPMPLQDAPAAVWQAGRGPALTPPDEPSGRRRWSGRKTAVVAGVVLALTGAGALAAVAATPNGIAGPNDRGGSMRQAPGGGQFPGGQGRQFGPGQGRQFGGQSQQGQQGRPGQQGQQGQQFGPGQSQQGGQPPQVQQFGGQNQGSTT